MSLIALLLLSNILAFSQTKVAIYNNNANLIEGKVFATNLITSFTNQKAQFEASDKTPNINYLLKNQGQNVEKGNLSDEVVSLVIDKLSVDYVVSFTLYPNKTQNNVSASLLNAKTFSVEKTVTLTCNDLKNSTDIKVATDEIAEKFFFGNIIAEQKAQKEKELALQKAKEEKVIADQKAKEEKAIADQKAKEEKAIANQKAKEEKAIADQKAKEERELAQQKEKEAAQQKAKEEKATADQKGQEERELAQQKEREIAEQKERELAQQKEREIAEQKEREAAQQKKATQPATAPVSSEENKNDKRQVSGIEAVDYVIPLKDLVIQFDNMRISFTNKVKQWEQGVNRCIERMNEDNANIAQIEKELNEKQNSASKKEIKELQARVKDQKKVYAQSVKNLKTEGASIISQLKIFEKMETTAIQQQFKNVIPKIFPSTTFPAVSTATTTVAFSNRVENLQTVSYLKSMDELVYWYQKMEHSFSKMIEANTQKAKAVIQKDKDLEKQLSSQKEQLSEYQKNIKRNKKEIAATKKEITRIENERKVLSKQMEKDSKELSVQINNYNKEVQTSFKEKMKSVIEKIDNAFKI